MPLLRHAVPVSRRREVVCPLSSAAPPTARCLRDSGPFCVWLPGGHAQTIYSALWAPAPQLSWQRLRVDTPDGDFVDIDWAEAAHAPQGSCPAGSDARETAPARVLLLLHGLEGSSRSHYARSIGQHFSQRGYAVVLPHFRGCSGEPNRTVRAYHSGDVAEVDFLVAWLAQRYPHAERHAVGVSLGGNALMRWAGESGHSLHGLQTLAAVSAPLDLAAGGRALSSGFNRWAYTRNFLRTLKPRIAAKARAFPGHFDAQAALAARDLYEFDNAYTAPIHGFRDTADYWARASALPWLHGVRAPALVLNALNDPFVPADSLPNPAQVSSHVLLHQPAQGGHVGFLSGRFPGHLRWLPNRLERFIEQGH